MLSQEGSMLYFFLFFLSKKSTDYQAKRCGIWENGHREGNDGLLSTNTERD
ncbi:hypothetical protein EI42_02284 [Thermosporothrix hazakensis]|jgi:hypothetical protein|uniref:Uncharacterized protein n=1 Tax=Thermosporothrix hazakensis TaxID=644383 RepID=A0A326U9H7_THEHA|nr:hypothetical protein EI42_02284 [Thermosporothrix hazakensis]